MKPVKITIKSVYPVTHNVLRFVLEKPDEINFVAGQAADISIDKEGWEEEKRPFTFTCLPSEDFLEFTIKTYPSHKGVTNKLLDLRAGDRFILHDIFGTIHYAEEGVFIAGGAGVTPFISILRNLKAEKKIGDNKLIFANKTKSDIINLDEFSKMLGNNFINVLSEEEEKGFLHGYINEEILKQYLRVNTDKVYICGPDPMIDSMVEKLLKIGVDEKDIIKEEF